MMLNTYATITFVSLLVATLYSGCYAPMAEAVDAPDLESGLRVRVQVSLGAPKKGNNMRVNIQQVSTYNEGYFIVSNKNGDAMFCRLCDGMQWDKLYDFLMRPLDIEIEDEEYTPEVPGGVTYWVYLV